MNVAIRIHLLLALVAGAAPAQIPVIPSIPAGRTQVRAFPNFESRNGHPVVEHERDLANFRLHLEYCLPDSDSRLTFRVNPERSLNLPSDQSGKWHTLELKYEQLQGMPPSFSAVVDGRDIVDHEILDSGADFRERDRIHLDRDFTAMVQFTTTGDGSLFSRCATSKWEPDAKTLAVRGGGIIYDIGWLGTLQGNTRGLADGKPHTAVVRSESGRVSIFVDGKHDGSRGGMTKPDRPGHVFHIGLGAKGYVGDLKSGAIGNLRFWDRALTDEESVQLSQGKADAVNTSTVNWSPPSPIATFASGLPGTPTRIALQPVGAARIRNAWLQPLDRVDHARLISLWNEDTLKKGQEIYNQVCATCHNSLTREGSMPTSRNFLREHFKNGNDPFRIYQTLTKGYGLMPPFAQYTPEENYALIHYIREAFLAPHNKGELFKVDDAYLASLPKAAHTAGPGPATKEDRKPYDKMNFGPALGATYEISPDNIAYKGIAVRLDSGEGGVSRGKAWMVYDHDTMRVAAVTTGAFVDWKNVAFDGTHSTHFKMMGEKLFTNPVGPGWADPRDGSWRDPRMLGTDGKPYGPLPREWFQYKGMHFHGQNVVQSYTVGDAEVLDAPEWISNGAKPVVIRTINVGKSTKDLSLRIAPEDAQMSIRIIANDALSPVINSGFQVLSIPARLTPVRFRIATSKALESSEFDKVVGDIRLPLDLSLLTHGGSPRWNQVTTTQGLTGANYGPFATDVITCPETKDNPWHSWMRLTGFDFFSDGRRAAVCTWMGDVWIVDGIDRISLGDLKWRRTATGLFQPLGLKIVNDTIYVTCRDQIAKLLDLNKDGETDFVECFNNDQQVTEHFHEFAMGLQTDRAGNFYYAKGARHALPGVVPQHGTLLRVSPDGSRTDILASGFRAPNGVCVNPDGTFFVTDQEGNWIPKNRINLVEGKGPSEFFGNLLGYTTFTDASDHAMEQPVCWITNTFDRSPSELVWVPQDAQWGPLNGSLLNLSYGYGKIYTVPFEKKDGMAQGGMCALPMPQFPTGVMRGRFHPTNGQFYGCGMFAWAGNQTQAGGFYRVRYTGKPAMQPLGLHFEKGSIRIDFSDALDPSSTQHGRYAVKVWGLTRSEKYGSPHTNEHTLEVESAQLVGKNSIMLNLPTLQPTAGIEIVCKLKMPDGSETERVIHGTIHRL